VVVVRVGVLGVIDEVMGQVGSHGSWIKLRSSGREGHRFVGCLSFLQSAQGGCTHGGSGAVSSFFFRLPPVVEVVLPSGGEGGVVGLRIGICIKSPSVWGGRDG
jgi:hypothetical protein